MCRTPNRSCSDMFASAGDLRIFMSLFGRVYRQPLVVEYRQSINPYILFSEVSGGDWKCDSEDDDGYDCNDDNLMTLGGPSLWFPESSVTAATRFLCKYVPSFVF